MANHKPIQFRAVHTKTRWRVASHETLSGALGKLRGARALFDHTNKAIDYAKHGEPLYVIVWDERQDFGEIVKPDHDQWDGLLHGAVSVGDILRLDEVGSPSNEELERLFGKVTQPAVRSPIGVGSGEPPESPHDAPAPETASDLEQQLQARVRESRGLTAEARRKRLSLSDATPVQIEVRTKAFIRNSDVIVEVLERAAGRCEQCGNLAPFLRASDGTPYLEVHHVVHLSMGGEDSVPNAQALCPNCHRGKHHGHPVQTTNER